MAQHRKHTVNRRSFMASAGAAFAFTVVAPQAARTYAANAKVKLGLIGCGGRGQWITDLFKQHGGYEIFACSDYFQDRIDSDPLIGNRGLSVEWVDSGSGVGYLELTSSTYGSGSLVNIVT